MKLTQIFPDYLRIEARKLFRFLPFYSVLLLMVGIGIANFWGIDEQIEEHYRRLLGNDPTLNFEQFYLSRIGGKIHFLAYFATLIWILLIMEIEQRSQFFTFRLPVLLLYPHYYLLAKWFIISILTFILLIVLHFAVFEFVNDRFPYGVAYLKTVPFSEILGVHFGQMLVVLGAISFVMFAFLLYFQINWIFALLVLGLCYFLGGLIPAFYPFSALSHLHFYEKQALFTADVVGACLAGGLAYFFCYQKICKS